MWILPNGISDHRVHIIIHLVIMIFLQNLSPYQSRKNLFFRQKSFVLDNIYLATIIFLSISVIGY